MSLVNALWYYSSAKPESGYSGAVRGYAQKLAARLGYSVRALAEDNADYLLRTSKSAGTPRIIIGAGEGLCWPNAVAPTCLKARPYGDQHGCGVSMHERTLCCLRLAKPRALALWPQVVSPALCICVANPHWLISDGQKWAADVAQWAHKSGVCTLYLTNSPRTNPLMWQEWQRQLLAALPQSMQIVVNDCHSPTNYYLEMLSMADALLMLGSSRSTAGEAALAGVPVYYCADDKAEESPFFASTEQMLGQEAAKRYQPLDTRQLIEFTRHQPLDVTDRYVEQALADLQATAQGVA